MTRFIKAYSERDSIVIEQSVVAWNGDIARRRANANLFIRRPGHFPAKNDTVVRQLSDGMFKHYRVITYLDPNSDLREIIRLDHVIDKLEEML